MPEIVVSVLDIIISGLEMTVFETEMIVGGIWQVASPTFAKAPRKVRQENQILIWSCRAKRGGFSPKDRNR